MNCFKYCLFLSLLMGTFCARGATPDLEVKKFTLKNGLRLLVHENRRLPIVSFRTYFDTGARHESIAERNTGASHFLEHMLFKTTKQYPVPGTINGLFAQMGASTNAATSYDYTMYQEDIPTEELDQLIAINSDRMKNLILVPEEFESERNVIFEERKGRYENDPSGALFLRAMEEVFVGTPYGGSVIGSIKDLTDMTPDQVFQFYQNFYTPDNMVIAVVGDVDADAVYKKIAKAYGDMPRASEKIKKYRRQVDDPARYRHRAQYGREVKIHGSSPIPLFNILYKGGGRRNQTGISSAYTFLYSFLWREFLVLSKLCQSRETSS